MNLALYTQLNSRFGFWLRQHTGKIFDFTRALPIGHGLSLQSKILRCSLAKTPILEFSCVCNEIYHPDIQISGQIQTLLFTRTCLRMARI